MAADLRARAATARTMLFVPGDRPERFDRAVGSGADLVVLDLEDAVGPDHKDHARAAVAAWLDAGHPAAVRINPPGTAWHDHDVAMLRTRPVVVVLPGATSASSAAVARAVGSTHPVVALVESATGVLGAAAVAATPGVVRLALGTFDLAAELGASPDDREAMAPARGALVLASAAAGLAQPVDGVTAAIDDRDVLESDLAHAVRLGFGGKLCIHPRQVAVVAEALRPTDAELRWARRVLSAQDAGAVAVVDGMMVDRPVLERARRLVAAAGPDA